jgi:hypothetical protein
VGAGRKTRHGVMLVEKQSFAAPLMVAAARHGDAIVVSGSTGWSSAPLGS